MIPVMVTPVQRPFYLLVLVLGAVWRLLPLGWAIPDVVALIAVYLIWSHGSPDIAQANRWTRVGLKLAGWGFLIGVLLFSGSLYALSLGAGALFGPVTPVGGLSFLIGWTGLAIAIWYRGGEDVADDGVGDERMGQ